MNNLHAVSALWKKMEQQNLLYVLKHNPSGLELLIPSNEEEEDYTTLIYFLSPEAAEFHKEMLVEKDIVRPSELYVDKCTLAEAFDAIPEIEELSKHVFDAPVQIVVVLARDGAILAREVLYDSSLLVN